MVIKRDSYAIIEPEEYSERKKNSQCPVCGKPKSDWNRRTDWMCCSSECTSTYNENVIYGWGELRERVFKRDNHQCVLCNRKDLKLIADHIVPIAIGGPQWDIDNIHTLCVECDKKKTKNDQKKIALARKIEKMGKEQRTLDFAKYKGHSANNLNDNLKNTKQ